MSGPKLTGPQLAVLREIANGNEAQYMPYMGRLCQNPYWYFHHIKGKFTRQVNRLIELGYVTKHYAHFGGTGTINSQGRAALAQIDAERGQG